MKGGGQTDIPTDRQTDRHTDKEIYYIDVLTMFKTKLYFEMSSKLFHPKPSIYILPVKIHAIGSYEC